MEWRRAEHSFLEEKKGLKIKKNKINCEEEVKLFWKRTKLFIFTVERWLLGLNLYDLGGSCSYGRVCMEDLLSLLGRLRSRMITLLY